MTLSKNLRKDNLHHAYLLEGARDALVPELLIFIESLGVKTVGNPDFSYQSFDSIKVEDARNLKSQGFERGFSDKKDAKKVFVISANSLVPEAQNTVLKLFEEPIENTHFFLIVPDRNILIKTLVSRFYVISARKDLAEETVEAEQFIKMPLQKRIDFIKELLTEPEGEEAIVIDSARPRAIKFLNAIETVLHGKFLNNSSGLLHPAGGTFPVQNSLKISFTQIFKVREFLRMPGSSTKSLMESIALTIPVIQ